MYWPTRPGFLPTLFANEATGDRDGAPWASTPKNFPPAGSSNPDMSYGRLLGLACGAFAEGAAPPWFCLPEPTFWLCGESTPQPASTSSTATAPRTRTGPLAVTSRPPL